MISGNKQQNNIAKSEEWKAFIDYIALSSFSLV